MDRAYRWPGLWSAPALMASGNIKAKRPPFFRGTGDLPKKVQMKLSKPPGFDHITPEKFSNLVAQKVREKEDEAFCPIG